MMQDSQPQIWTLHSNLLLAIQDNDLEAAEDLLRHESVDPDVCFAIGHGSSTPAICLCVERGLYSMAKLFISYGCSVNSCDENGYTALHFSCSHQFLDLVKLLISNRANTNAVSNFGQTPLHLACQQSSLDIVSCLVKGGANIEKKDSDGRTPLSMACICNQTDIARYLIQETECDVNTMDSCFNSPLLHAVNSGISLNPGLIKVLLESGADPNHTNHTGSSAIFTVVRRSSEHDLNGMLALDSLIEYGVDMNQTDFRCHHLDQEETPLHLSISRGQDTLTEKLIRSGADVNLRNQRGFSPLHRLAREEKTDLVKLLVATGADMSQPRKNFYFDESGMMRDIRDPEIQAILSFKGVSTLKHLVRVSLRKWLERRADRVIRQLVVPISLKQYLLLLDL